MSAGRLEAFSDGVLAIIITIMVLELKVPHGADLAALLTLRPVLLAYVLSFVYVGIYWNNHHHLIRTVKHVTGRIMWANLHLLFWLSLFPFVTGWVGEFPDAPLPAALYGVVLLAAAFAWLVLQGAIIASGGILQSALGGDLKGKLSPLLYLAGIGLSFVRPWLSYALYLVVAALWVIPDRRIESRLASKGHEPSAHGHASDER
jgi:uncharacterized membrane protein